MKKKSFLLLGIIFLFSLTFIYASVYSESDVYGKSISSSNGNFIKKGGDSTTGTYTFNGGWQNNGLTIQDGDIYAQTGYFYNLTSLNISQVNLTATDNFIVNNRLGVGTLNPISPLEVNGITSIGGDIIPTSNNAYHVGSAINSPNAKYIKSFNGYDANFIRRLILYPQATGNPRVHLEANADGILLGKNIGGTSFQIRFGGVTSSYPSIKGNSTSPTIYFLKADSSGDADISAGNGIFSGNVGIGRSSPNYPLDVNGSIRVFDSTGSIDNGLAFQQASGRRWWLGILNDTTDKLSFSYGSNPHGTDVFTFDGGNVGIGTGTPNTKLDIQNGDVRILGSSEGTDRTLIIGELGATGNASILKWDADEDVLAVYGWGDSAANQDFFVLDTVNHNVGIDTFSPTAKLDVRGDLFQNVNSLTPAVTFKQRGTGDILNIFDDTVEVFTILDGGNVGIGTDSPNSKLQIDVANDDTYKYLQIDANSTAPPSSDCNADNEAGRMFFEDTIGADKLWICAGATDGWVSTNFA